jgi:hypothetical protein
MSSISWVGNFSSSNFKITGTDNDDVIEIRDSPGAGHVDVYVNGELKYRGIPKDQLQHIKIEGGKGNDRIINYTDAAMWADGGDGHDSLIGGGGADYLIGGAGINVLDGAGGDDYLEGGDGNDALYGRAGDDILVGGGGNNFLAGEAGNDVFDVRSGTNVADGGEGSDKYANGNNQNTKISDTGASGTDSMIDSMALQSITEDQSNAKTKKGKNGNPSTTTQANTGAPGANPGTTEGTPAATTTGTEAGNTSTAGSAPSETETGSEEGGSTEESSDSGDGAGIWEIIAKMGEKVDKQLANVMEAINRVDTSAESDVTAKQLAEVQVQTAKLGWFGQTWQTVGQTAAQTGEKAGSAGKPS